MNLRVNIKNNVKKCKTPHLVLYSPRRFVSERDKSLIEQTNMLAN